MVLGGDQLYVKGEGRTGWRQGVGNRCKVRRTLGSDGLMALRAVTAGILCFRHFEFFHCYMLREMQIQEGIWLR